MFSACSACVPTCLATSRCAGTLCAHGLSDKMQSRQTARLLLPSTVETERCKRCRTVECSCRDRNTAVGDVCGAQDYEEFPAPSIQTMRRRLCKWGGGGEISTSKQQNCIVHTSQRSLWYRTDRALVLFVRPAEAITSHTDHCVK
jgi:hypothetical protein